MRRTCFILLQVSSPEVCTSIKQLHQGHSRGFTMTLITMEGGGVLTPPSHSDVTLDIVSISQLLKIIYLLRQISTRERDFDSTISIMSVWRASFLKTRGWKSHGEGFLVLSWGSAPDPVNKKKEEKKKKRKNLRPWRFNYVYHWGKWPTVPWDESSGASWLDLRHTKVLKYPSRCTLAVKSLHQLKCAAV